MERLPAGTHLDPGDIRVADAAEGTPIVLLEPAGEAPHGLLYAGYQGDHRVLLTVLEPRLVAAPEDRARLTEALQPICAIEHKNLLQLHGVGAYQATLFTVQSWPEGGTARAFAQKRLEQDKPIDLKTAFTLVGHVCNGLNGLHQAALHGFVTLDTIYINKSGRILLGSAGFGAWLPRCPRFGRFRGTGRLPNLPPEQLETPPRLVPGTDVFGIASVLIELLSSRPLPNAGHELGDLGLPSNRNLIECLQRAIAPDPGARPPDVLTFKAELADAFGLRPGRGQPAAPPVGTASPPPPRDERMPSVAPAPPEPAPLPSTPSEPAPATAVFDPAAAPSPPPMHATEAGLGLDLRDLAVDRLATLDGQTDLEDLQPGPHAPDEQSAYFDSFGDPQPDLGGSSSANMVVSPDDEARKRRDLEKRRYFVVHNGVDHGPYPIDRLQTMIREGSLKSIDTLRADGSTREQLVVDIPQLHELCEQLVHRQERHRHSAVRPTAPAAAAAMARDRDRSTLGGTLLLILLTLAGFGIVGWFLWQRAGGGM